MQDSLEDIENLCRLCGEDSTGGIDICTDTTENWVDHIKNLPVEVSCQQFPLKIIHSLSYFFRFKRLRRIHERSAGLAG